MQRDPVRLRRYLDLGGGTCGLRGPGGCALAAPFPQRPSGLEFSPRLSPLPFPGANPRILLLCSPVGSPPRSANLFVRMARLTPGKEQRLLGSQTPLLPSPGLLLTAPRGSGVRVRPLFTDPVRYPQLHDPTGKPPALPSAQGRAPTGRSLPTGLAGDWLRPRHGRRKEPIRAAAAGGRQPANGRWARLGFPPPAALALRSPGTSDPDGEGAPSLTLPPTLTAGRREASEEAEQGLDLLRA